MAVRNYLATPEAKAAFSRSAILPWLVQKGSPRFAIIPERLARTLKFGELEMDDTVFDTAVAEGYVHFPANKIAQFASIISTTPIPGGGERPRDNKVDALITLYKARYKLPAEHIEMPSLARSAEVVLVPKALAAAVDTILEQSPALLTAGPAASR